MASSNSTNSIRDDLIKQYKTEAKVYFYLRDFDWTHKGACAAMGNINQESSFSTTSISTDGFGSQGLCQWTGSRLTELKTYLKSHSYSFSDVKGQCDFLNHEIATKMPTLLELLKNKNTATTLDEMTESFCSRFERPDSRYANLKRRKESAQTYYKRYNGTYDNTSSSGVEIDFNRTTAKLSSSNNYEYIQAQEEESSTSKVKTSESIKAIQEAVNKTSSNTSNTIKKITTTITDTVAQSIINSISANRAPAKVFKSSSESSGSTLPITNTWIEAPFIEIEIGGVKLGTYNVADRYDTYPNYVKSIDIKKTNGTLNEYTINLIHQVAPGDNPNYIAELLSKTGYNTFKIKYGDANYGKYYYESEALLTSVKTSFALGSNQISYTLTASSLSYITASTKLDFNSFTDKPSNIIINLIKDKNLALSDYFTGMINTEKVLQYGLIPTNDKIVDIASQSGITVVNYLKYLVSLMVDENEDVADKSSYYLAINDELDERFSGNTFRIKEVIADSNELTIDSDLYEVNLGYPDSSLVFDFSVNTNYEWAAVYNISSNITTYQYDIDNYGSTYSTRRLGLSKPNLSNSEFTIDSNLWKTLTRFPLTATLTTKELLAPMLLLSYIKINNYYYGNKRITSGLYIVTGQEDSVSSSGCRTKLTLTRVASEEDTLSTDGRVRT